MRHGFALSLLRALSLSLSLSAVLGSLMEQFGRRNKATSGKGTKRCKCCSRRLALVVDVAAVAICLLSTLFTFDAEKEVEEEGKWKKQQQQKPLELIAVLIAF